MATFDTRPVGKDTGFYIDCEFQASWHQNAGIPQPLTPGMVQLLNIAFQAGKDERAAEIRKLLGAK